MADCQPIYLLAYEQDELVGRASLWLIRNEPIPVKLPAFLMKLISAATSHWPLLICRSPMANTSGLILPEGTRREAILGALTEAAYHTSKQLGAAILVFDYLDVSSLEGWPSNFATIKVPGSGTVLENHWTTMEEYLAQGGKKDRQHYKRSLRKAAELGIRLERCRKVSDVEAALKLIRQVERRYASPPNPWMRNLLENVESVGGTWLEAHMEKKLVGCGLILEDNGAQMTTALGLAEGITYAYFLLVYASLEEAFAKQVRLLRWGSGAYEVKERLGFRLAQDNFVVARGTNRLTNLIGKWAAF